MGEGKIGIFLFKGLFFLFDLKFLREGLITGRGVVGLGIRG